VRAFFQSSRGHFWARSAQRVPKPPVISVAALSTSSIRVTVLLSDRDDADDVEIYRGTASGGPYTLLTTEAVAGNITFDYDATGLSAATPYFFVGRSKIDPENSLQRYSEYSNEATATTSGASTPALPVNLLVTETARSTTHIDYDLSWDAVVGATSYDWWIEPSTDGGYENGTVLAPNNQAASPVSVSIPREEGIDEASFYVQARNATGPGPYEHTAIVVTGNLHPPTLNTAVASGSDGLLTYTENADAPAADVYEIERSDNGAAFALIDEVLPSAAQPYQDTALAAGTYKYRLRARDDDTVDRFSGYSAEKVITIGGSTPTGFVKGQDFTAMNSLADLNTEFSIQTAGNILFDDGTQVLAHTGQASGTRGLMYRFIPRPQDCADQSLVTYLNFSSLALEEIWVEAQIVFSSNWTTANSFCAPNGGGEDYKTLLTYFWPGQKYRFDYRVGTKLSRIHHAGSAFPNPSLVPINVAQSSSPVRATDLWDGQPHVHRIHLKQLVEGSTYKEIMQAMVDGQVTHSYKDLGIPARTNEFMGRIKIGANRNYGAEEEMYVHWQHIYLYDTDPGWFTGVAVTDYTP
jgi:hypothetical protein